MVLAPLYGLAFLYPGMAAVGMRHRAQPTERVLVKSGRGQTLSEVSWS